MDKNKKIKLYNYLCTINSSIFYIILSFISSGFISRYQVGILILILINVILAASLM